MIDPAKLIAFAGVTALTSVVPGPSMLFVLTQSAWRGARGGALALAGLQLGYIVWFVLAGLGLGGLVATSPLAFRVLTLGGAGYLAWLGVQAWRHAGEGATALAGNAHRSDHAFRDGIVVALSNPKSLLYVVALLPQFIDPAQGIAAQLALLALVAMIIDIAIALAYVLAGNRLSAAMARPELRRRIERTIGAIFLLLACGAAYAGFEAART